MEYNIVAVVSTTGGPFDPEGLDAYSDEQSALPEPLYENQYGVIILPREAAQSGSGYRYYGPVFTEQDLYAKALINQQYWGSTGESGDPISSQGSLLATHVTENDKGTVVAWDGDGKVSAAGHMVIHLLCGILNALLFLHGLG
jgi:hypothetical protein